MNTQPEMFHGDIVAKDSIHKHHKDITTDKKDNVCDRADAWCIYVA